MKFTDVAININTNTSTAIASAVWTGSSDGLGRLLVRYTSSTKVYAFADVPLGDVLTLLATIESGESLGSAMHKVLRSRRAAAV